MKLVILDLDKTLWPFFSEHVSKIKSENLDLFEDAKDVLMTLKTMREEIVVAVASGSRSKKTCVRILKHHKQDWILKHHRIFYGNKQEHVQA